MKLISTYAHGVFDYVGAVVLFFAPEIFAFDYVGGWPVFLPRAIATIVVIQALLTRYELSIARLLPMRAHLWVDYALGLFLAISPWVFDFADAPANVWVPHLVVGIAIFGLALVTEPASYARRHPAARSPVGSASNRRAVTPGR